MSVVCKFLSGTSGLGDVCIAYGCAFQVKGLVSGRMWENLDSS